MRIRVFSDLHLEFAHFDPPALEADVVVLAGDIAVGLDGLHWALEAFPDLPVVYVLGNHEYYGHQVPELGQKLRSAAAGTNVHVLDEGHVQIAGVHFVGATLWTDLALYGDAMAASGALSKIMHDYRAITVSPQRRKFYPADTARIHKQNLRWMDTLLPTLEGPVIVVTHHAPSPNSLDPRYGDHISNAGYASRLEDFIARHQPDVWIHGHIHTGRSYWVGSTLVASNPRGYPRELGNGFDPDFVIEVHREGDPLECAAE